MPRNKHPKPQKFHTIHVKLPRFYAILVPVMVKLCGCRSAGRLVATLLITYWEKLRKDPDMQEDIAIWCEAMGIAVEDAGINAEVNPARRHMTWDEAMQWDYDHDPMSDFQPDPGYADGEEQEKFPKGTP